MNSNIDFYKWFNKLSPNLGIRELSFKKIFKYLDSMPDPIIIVETGRLHEYASHVGAKLLFSNYQSAWNKFNKES